MGKEYPLGATYFRDRCHKAFIKNKDIKDEQQIKELIKRGEFVMKELEALYMLRKYRTLNKRYSNDNYFKKT